MRVRAAQRTVEVVVKVMMLLTTSKSLFLLLLLPLQADMVVYGKTLGGNCKTLLIANIYGEASFLEETVATLTLTLTLTLTP